MSRRFINSVKDKTNLPLLPKCPICFDNFDLESRKPKVLICAHSVCEWCIQALDNNRRNANPNHFYAGIFCPSCREPTREPGLIKTNYQFREALECFQRIANDDVSYVSCSGCSGMFIEKDVHICIDCSKKGGLGISDDDEIPKDIDLEKFTLCSTCVLAKHLGADHNRISFQTVRVRLQRESNLIEMKKLSEESDNERTNCLQGINQMMHFMTENDQKMLKLFVDSDNSYDQKNTHAIFKKWLDTKSNIFKHLNGMSLKWTKEMESNISGSNDAHLKEENGDFVMNEENNNRPFQYFFEENHDILLE